MPLLPGRQRRAPEPWPSLQQKENSQGAHAGLSLRRPVMAVVINALIIVGGLAAFLGIELGRELPEVDQPVTVTTIATVPQPTSSTRRSPR